MFLVDQQQDISNSKCGCKVQIFLHSGSGNMNESAQLDTMQTRWHCRFFTVALSYKSGRTTLGQLPPMWRVAISRPLQRCSPVSGRQRQTNERESQFGKLGFHKYRDIINPPCRTAIYSAQVATRTLASRNLSQEKQSSTNRSVLPPELACQVGELSRNEGT